jgi:MraZ protein
MWKNKAVDYSGKMWDIVEHLCYFSVNRSTSVADMSSFLGEFNIKLDAKGRVKVPAGLKRQLQPGDNGRFVVNRGFEDCLVLYPWTAWEKFSAQVVQRLNPFKKSHRAFQRSFFRGATELQLDANDRLLLPKALLAYAGISKEAVLFAHSNKVEIWDQAKYNQTMQIDSDEFADLAEEVMGGFDDGLEDVG